MVNARRAGASLIAALVTATVTVGAAWWGGEANDRLGGQPWIEQRASEAFAATAHAPQGSARYRIDATVLFPLLSIPVASRDDVGFATALADHRPGEEAAIHRYEFFGASFPERARGLNRMGFFREVVQWNGRSPEWTAHFGALSSSPETSRSEVALDSDESVRPYTVLDGFTDRDASVNRDARVVLDGSWTSADGFYDQLLPVWRETEREPETRMPSTAQTELRGFLSTVEHALQVAAGEVAAGDRLDRVRYPFVHKAEPKELERRGHKVDRGRARRYVELGLVAPGAVVHRLDYRILDQDGDRVQSFRLWTELPVADGGPDGPPPMPLGFEFKPKSFLRLEAELVSD